MSVEYLQQRRQKPLTWVISGDKAAIEIEYWCKLAKDLPDGKKARVEIILRGASIFTVKEGRISRLVDYMWAHLNASRICFLAIKSFYLKSPHLITAFNAEVLRG